MVDIPLEDFLSMETRYGAGKRVVRCNCGFRLCEGWADLDEWEDFPKAWQNYPDFIGPLEKGEEF